ncbi:piezo-type mechanosensitive ion channel component 1-like [Notothenia coriiceps]|uniref:Piezo-type mechanosensitive ion channel component 1-like n=1 Tax=Notothenia coriiceps TaxID=8208 RepID=A0A6I9MWG3_9TELE|nr:PREDICTED: piezo-type mechanosensitive ion channel component 1-like [Notothenia coriiceps]
MPLTLFFISLSVLLYRLFGLKDIIIPGNCSFPYDLNLNADHDWPVYVNPGILLFLYVTVATVLKTGYHGASNQVKEEQQQEKSEEEEMVELRSWNQPKDNYEDDTRLMLLSTGSESSRGGTLAEESPADLGINAFI